MAKTNVEKANAILGGKDLEAIERTLKALPEAEDPPARQEAGETHRMDPGQMRDPENPLAELTALDWIAVGLVGLATLFCFQFPFLTAPHFAKMFADFGGPLPDLTQLALTTWFPLMLGLNPASIVFHALSQQHSLGRRRLLIVASFVMSIAAATVCLVAMYLPIFSLAGKIE